ncbi:MAG: hypothetical protein IKX27_06310 [Oscillospiraceae bacterium]|nr:hypothetical protein [Oscillospiraceae bacterium]MBR5071495.1 hypothetical protein [Oscillospiraceae bacterium]
MTGEFSKEISIVPSLCDSSGKLGIPDTAALFMDIAAEHSDSLGIGQKDLNALGGFWLTVKTMLRFFRRPGFGEKATLTTWPEIPDKRRCLRDYVLASGGEVLCCGKTEWAVLDMTSGRLRHVDSIYPEGLELTDRSSISDPFTRFEDELTDGELLGRYTVRSTDIDLGGHMNNVAYLRAFASLFSSAEWNAADLQSVEIWYRAQCFEGEELAVYRKPKGNCTEASFIKSDGNCALQLRYS